MTWKIVSKCALLAVVLLISAGIANAGIVCRCGADAHDYQIKQVDGGTDVTVWVVNTCPFNGHVLATVVGSAQADGALLKEDYPVFLPRYSRRPVTLHFDDPIALVVYWYATRLGAGPGPI